MAQDVIATVCDFNGTLGPDSTDKLVREPGLESGQFRKRDVVGLVEDGGYHTLAYLNEPLEPRSTTRPALQRSQNRKAWVAMLLFIPIA
jgi:hypothetical protein